MSNNTTTKTNIANRFGNNTEIQASNDFAINSFMMSDAGCAAFNFLNNEGLITTKDINNYFLYATSLNVKNKSNGFDPNNIAYTGDITLTSGKKLDTGAGQDLEMGRKLAVASWNNGAFKTLTEEMDENSKVTHVYGMAGGGSTIPAIVKQTTELKKATTNNDILDDDDFDLESLATTLNKYGILATIVAPRKIVGKKWDNYQDGIKSFLTKDGVYNPQISYQILKIDDIERTTSNANLSDKEILEITSLHYYQTNQIIKKFYTSESFEGTDIDSSEILNALADCGEFVIHKASGVDIKQAWTNFVKGNDYTQGYKTLNSEASIEGACSALILFEYPQNYNFSDSDINNQNVLIKTVGDQTNTEDNNCVIKYCNVYGNVKEPTINCIFTGISSESRRSSLAKNKNDKARNNIKEQLKRDNEALATPKIVLTNSQKATKRHAENRLANGTATAEDIKFLDSIKA